MGKPYAKEGPSAEDKALDLFADMMIERIQSLSGKDGWKKPWFTEGALQWPKNLNGREYNGMNAMMLLLHCEKEGYKIPRFCTFDRIQQFNKTGKKDEEQKPRVSVLKGEHSFPVMLTTFTVVNKETKEHIKWEDYKLLFLREQFVEVVPRLGVIVFGGVAGNVHPVAIVHGRMAVEHLVDLLGGFGREVALCDVGRDVVPLLSPSVYAAGEQQA